MIKWINKKIKLIRWEKEKNKLNILIKINTNGADKLCHSINCFVSSIKYITNIYFIINAKY